MKPCLGPALLAALSLAVSARADIAATVAASAHGQFKCADCHDDFDATHGQPAKPVDCVSCHDDAGPKHPFHLRLAATPIPPGPDTSCVACHGTHAITAADSPQFAFTDGRQTEMCGRCHTADRDDFLHSAHAAAFSARVQGVPPPTCLSCHNQRIAGAPGAKPDVVLKLKQDALCESCHVDKPGLAGQSLRGKRFVASFDQSVHGAALHAGNAAAANCVDCHGAHEMNLAFVPTARTSKQRAAETCGLCHAQQAQDFAGSVHAAALRRGALDSPSCPDCHGEHDIRAHTDPKSPVFSRNLAQAVCAQCHASLALTTKYGIASDVFQTFSDSYHGLAERGGSVAVANCASCHGAHAIKASSDPASSINPANLPITCGQCHQGANARFALGAVHVDPAARKGQDGQSPILHLIASVYVLLIVFVVGGMFVHNLLDFLKKVRRKVAIQQGLIPEEPVPHRLYLRMTVHERLQHALLVLSFTVLVATGFMLHYPDAWWVAGIRRLSSHAFAWRSLIHRVAGVAMLGGAAWHLVYVIVSPAGRELLQALLPRRRDFTDPWKVVRYNLGLAQEKPKFGRFCYIEKAEYWAVVWGTLVMGVTGVLLWFDNLSMGLLTKLGFDISRTIHFYEAVLASLAIVVWHFYWVIYNPDVYPMNLSWLTGRMSAQELQEEHPLELERLKAQEGKNPPPGA